MKRRLLPLACLAIALTFVALWARNRLNQPPQPPPPEASPKPSLPPNYRSLRSATGSSDSIKRAALVQVDGLEILHLRLSTTEGTINEAFRLGRAVAELLGPVIGSPNDNKANKAEDERERWMAAHVNNVVPATPLRPSSWPADLLQITQGRSSAGSPSLPQAYAGLLAGGLGFAARAQRFEDVGVVLVARYTGTDAASLASLRPIVLERDGKALFVLGLEGVPLGLSGMNEAGLVLVSGSPRFDARDYTLGPGPDLLVQCDALLRLATDATMETGSSVGQMLLPFNETTYISRLSSPGILLAADPLHANRFEWRSVGSDAHRSSGLEFAALESDPPPSDTAENATLTASHHYASVELQRPKDEDDDSVPELPKHANLEVLMKQVAALRDGITLVYVPSQLRVVVNVGGQSADIRLGRMKVVVWE